MSAFLAAIKQRERDLEAIQRRTLRSEQDVSGILSSARETKHKHAQSLVEQARAYDRWVYERAMREVKYMNAPMPEELIKALATKAQRLPSLSPSRADSEDGLELAELERSSAPARIRASPSHQPPLAPLQEEKEDQRGSDAGARSSIPLFFPWETESPRYSSPNLHPAPPHPPQPREGYATPPPSLWNLGWHPHQAGGGGERERLGSAGLFNMLQGVKDEDLPLPPGGQRPTHTYEPNLHAPLATGRAHYHLHARTGAPWYNRPGSQQQAGGPRRTRWVWRPRPGFPGALAKAPAGYTAMLDEVRAAFVLHPADWATARPATAEPLTAVAAPPLTAAPLPQSPAPLHAPSAPLERLDSSLLLTASGRLIRSLSAEPLGVLVSPPAQKQQADQEQAQEVEEEGGVQLPAIQPGRSDSGSTAAAAATRKTAGARKAVLQSVVWVGARGRVVGDRVVP